MSLAGRFFPSTMRMDSELRLAIAGPRLGSRPGRAGRQGPVQRAAGGRAAGAGLGARGRAAPGRGGQGGAVNAGAEEPLPLHSPPPPPHVRGTLRAGGPISGPGWLGLRRSLAAWGGVGRGLGEALTPCGRGGARGAPPSPRRGSAPRGRAADLCGRRAWPEGRARVRGGCGVQCVRGGGGLGGGTRDGGGRGGPPWPPEAGAWEAPHRCQVNEQPGEFRKQCACLC